MKVWSEEFNITFSNSKYLMHCYVNIKLWKNTKGSMYVCIVGYLSKGKIQQENKV